MMVVMMGRNINLESCCSKLVSATGEGTTTITPLLWQQCTDDVIPRILLELTWQHHAAMCTLCKNVVAMSIAACIYLVIGMRRSITTRNEICNTFFYSRVVMVVIRCDGVHCVYLDGLCCGAAWDVALGTKAAYRDERDADKFKVSRGNEATKGEGCIFFQIVQPSLPTPLLLLFLRAHHPHCQHSHGRPPPLCRRVRSR